jgi:hypothetical protein
LPSEIEIPTCSNCGEQWIDGETTEAIDRALTDAYRAALLEKAERSIELLRAQNPQRLMERLLGLSAGYLSKLRNAKSDPSPTLVAALMLLANEPSRFAELEQLWSATARIGPQADAAAVVGRGFRGKLALITSEPDAAEAAYSPTTAEGLEIRTIRNTG